METRQKHLEFRINFNSKLGFGTDKRKAPVCEFDPEGTFKNILKSLPKRMERWNSIEFEFEGQLFDVSRHLLLETDFNFWQSIFVEELS